jgi:cysteine synthase
MISEASSTINDTPREVVEARLALLEQAAVVRTIGRTPLLRLRAFERSLGLPDFIEIHLKTEWVNPGGSIKDRTALSIIWQR